ncbi:hypothetical protein A5649_13470 [Mycolicibacter heraklionensis]|uniref:Uncharacterized protein n=1 Tax=Mycolicibacter heraklionensis TaxID=512402 RepID=A0AA91IZS7_9MYCO|nr:hypothetical protein A5649_13470 [Mycolicibacter heraklionensis]
MQEVDIPREGRCMPLVLRTGGEPLWSHQAISLFTGLTVGEIQATGAQRIADLPAEVFRAARRRSGESAARINTRDWLAVLRFRTGELFPGVELILDAAGVWLPRSPEVDRWAAGA